MCTSYPPPNEVLFATLSPIERAVLALCEMDDWTTEGAQTAWARFRVQWGKVNDMAVRYQLYRRGLIDISDRITEEGILTLTLSNLRAQ